MTDLERVARAICKVDGLDPDAPVSELSWALGHGPDIKPGDPNWRDYVESARAAIEALMEPSEAMWDAGRADIESWGEVDCCNFPGTAAGSVFQAMLRAVLEGK